MRAAVHGLIMLWTATADKVYMGITAVKAVAWSEFPENHLTVGLKSGGPTACADGFAGPN